MRKMWRLVVVHADIPTEDEIDSEWFEEVDLIDISPNKKNDKGCIPFNRGDSK